MRGCNSRLVAWPCTRHEVYFPQYTIAFAFFVIRYVEQTCRCGVSCLDWYISFILELSEQYIECRNDLCLLFWSIRNVEVQALKSSNGAHGRGTISIGYRLLALAT